jgi:Sulfotransferase family
MYGRGCIERLRECAPHARIIVMLRNPVDRAFSQYQYRAAYIRYDEPFDAMCAREFERVAQGDAARMEYGCLDRSRYAPQIEQILGHFPRSQLHFIVFEDFIRAQREHFARVQRWLGITEYDVGEARENPGGEARNVTLARLLYHPKHRALRGWVGRLLPTTAFRRRVYDLLGRMNLRHSEPHSKTGVDPVLRRKLLADFERDIERVERLTGLDLATWRRA